MPKLLQINSVVNTGSTGRIAEQLGLLAMNYGWDSYIAYGRNARDSQSQLIKIGNKYGVYIHAFMSRMTDRHGFYSKNDTKSFLHKIEGIKPDVVHLHNLHGYYINVPMLIDYLNNHNIPTIITMHDFWMLTGHCAYINQSCSKWKTGCRNCERLASYPKAIVDNSSRNWLEKVALFSNCDNITLVPVSNWLNGFVSQSLLKDLKRQVIFNGIDTNVFTPYKGKTSLSIDIDRSRFTIICVSTQWLPNNGYPELLHLSSILPSDCQMILVGVTEAQKKMLPKNVIGFSKTENLQQLQELYTISDIILNPNREVTFGMVTAEAMACGTPAIVLRGTAGEDVVDSETGFVVDCVDDIPSMIPLIKSRLGKTLSKKCRERIMTHFELDQQFKKYINLYSSLLK